jgi:hypothetical protein
MIIVIDFDGTCVTHEFPNIGKDIGAEKVLKKLIQKGHRLILFTMRCNHTFIPNSHQPDIIVEPGNYLTEAVNWFKERDIPLFGIQKHPNQSGWTSSPKAYGHLIIDDIALGCPVKFDRNISDKPFIDWVRIEGMLTNNGIL